MALYDRDYMKKNAASMGAEGSYAKSESDIVAFVKQTYKLFGASMLAGAAGAYVGIPMANTIASMYWFIAIPWMLFGMFGIRMVRHKPGINLLALFAFTFVGGMIITPLLSVILSMQGGGAIVGNAFLMTAVLFGGLSFFAINTTKDFTSWGKPLMFAFIVLLVFSLINIFVLQSPMMHIIIQGVFLFVISAMVLYDTQNIINGMYDSAVEAALVLYIDFFNMFVTLLQIFGIFGSDD
ncbi:MAG: Bax inhibitor-1/YccA family protein [Campylobacterota bacterium]